MEKREKMIEDNKKVLYYNIIQNNKIITSIRIDKILWESFKERAKELKISPNRLTNLLIQALLEGKTSVQGNNINININQTVVPVMQKVEQIQVSNHDEITEAQLNAYFNFIEKKILTGGGELSLRMKDRICDLAKRSRKLKPETIDKLSKFLQQ